ncbi:Aste57867_14843 [Aphanomyces stellatus]|uniref:Aste57867_14843 protein n=1 Tax=Aphanomyces stellatus TaxID=120398 RepID=A0A485L1Q9_9STRA|nr:hypothetical protein As57867_014787 [Aphanomyces stellatus]VFT91661.1 Aste57867_14843 [Aphanomyces stellatus]
MRHRSRSPVRHRSRSPARNRSRSRGRFDRKRSTRESEKARDSPVKRPRKNTDEGESKERAPDKTTMSEKVTEKNGEISMSIEETNKLRLSMGLKPLRLDKPKDKEVDLTKSREEREDDARQKELKEALEKSKRKREFTEKLKGQSLGQILAQDASSTLDWVRQSRTKKIDVLGKETEGPKKYGADELKGLTVAHDARAFDEGEDVILTLKDQRILTGDLNDVNEDGDELENVHISEMDRRAEREARMKKASGPVYSGFDDDEFTSVIGGKAPLKKRLLAQYDEEDEFVAAREKKKFSLSDAGTHHVDKAAAPAETVVSGSLSLATIKQRSIEEYYTVEEMAVFTKKQSKKLRKKQKSRKTLVEDDEEETKDGEPTDFLQQLEQDAAHDKSDHGKRRATTAATEVPPEEAERRAKFEHARKRANDRVQAMVEKMKNAADDVDEELSESLARSRRMALLAATQDTREANDARVVLQLAGPKAANIHKEEEGRGDTMVFNEATDFEVRVKNAMDERAARAVAAQAQATTTTVEEDMDDEETKDDDINVDEDDEEEESWGVEEPLVQSGMAATLALLRNRGDLNDKIQVRQSGRANDHRERDIEDELQVKDGVKLDYRDEFGRLLTKKEAFRRISYRFHGHTPGKKRQEKRLKQIKEEIAQQKNLGNVAQRMQTLEKRQKAAKQAHVVLSG